MARRFWIWPRVLAAALILSAGFGCTGGKSAAGNTRASGAGPGC